MHAEPDRRRVRQVDDAAIVERPAVVDPHDQAASILEVGHPHVTRKRQALVRRGHGVHVVGLARRGIAAVELGPVPGGQAAFDIALAARQHGVGPAEHGVGRMIAVTRARLGARHRLGHAADVGWNRRAAIGLFARADRRHRRGGRRGRRLLARQLALAARDRQQSERSQQASGSRRAPDHGPAASRMPAASSCDSCHTAML